MPRGTCGHQVHGRTAPTHLSLSLFHTSSSLSNLYKKKPPIPPLLHSNNPLHSNIKQTVRKKQTNKQSLSLSLIGASKMDVRRRHVNTLPPPAAAGEALLKPHKYQQAATAKASDALPLPLYLTNGVFFTLFFSVAYFLLHRWREKIRNSIPLHVVTLSELAAVVSLIASVIYLLGFFGIDFVQSVLTGRNTHDAWDVEDEIDSVDRFIIEEESLKKPCGAGIECLPVVAAVAVAELPAIVLEVLFEIQ